MTGDFFAEERSEIRITPADMGKRVSVRRILEVFGGRPVFTDAVGVLASWDNGVMSITRGSGETVRFPYSSVVAGKVVPPPPARRPPRASAEELQERVSRGWPAPKTERLGEWTLRAAGGFTRRANSVLAIGDPGLPLDAALARVRRWYAERGLPAYLQVLDDSPLVAGLARRDWTDEAPSLVRTAALAPLAEGPGADAVALSRLPDAAWLAGYRRTGDFPAEAVEVLSGGPSVWFATAPGAVGRCVVDGRWATFGAVEVEPARRRAGLATAVMAALSGAALREGATAACLQVEADNEGAGELYDRMGFTTHHAYHYRVAPHRGEA